MKHSEKWYQSPKFVITICMFVALLEGFDIQAIGIAAPKLFALLNIAPQEGGKIFSSGQLGLVIGSIIGGKLCDKFERYIILIAAIILFGLGSYATPFANNFNSLLIIRLITGIGFGAAMPSLVGIAQSVSSAKNRVKNVSIVMAGMPLGGAIVAAFSAIYLKKLGWQSIFYIGGTLPLFLILAISQFKGLAQIKTDKTASNNIIETLFGGNRTSISVLLWLIFILSFSLVYVMLNWLPILMNMRGFDARIGQLSSMVFNLVSVVGIVIFGVVVDKYGFRKTLPIGYIGLLIGIIGMAITKDVTPLLISFGTIGFCLFGVQYALTGLTPNFYPVDGRGIATGAAISAGRLGSIIGPLIAGYIIKSHFGGPSVPHFMIPACIIAGILTIFLIRKNIIIHD